MKFGRLNHVAVATRSVLLALLVAGCSQSEGNDPNSGQPRALSLLERDKALCKKQVTENLLNPETVQFFEFNPTLESDPSLAVLGQNVRQYRLRYKADSKVGLKVTSVETCTVVLLKGDNDDVCMCMDDQGK